MAHLNPQPLSMIINFEQTTCSDKDIQRMYAFAKRKKIHNNIFRKMMYEALNKMEV